MRLLLIVNDLSGTHGWSTYTLNIVQEAVKAGYEVHAFIHKKTESEIQGIVQHELLPEPTAVSWNPYAIYKNCRRIRRTIEIIQPDVVHVVAEPYIQMFSLLHTESYMLVLTLHGTYARLPLTVPKGIQRLISKYFFEEALKNVSDFISVSERTKRIFLAYVPQVDSKLVAVIHNSISTEGVAVETSQKSKTEPYHILTLGAVKARKGIHTAIEILSEWAVSRKKKVIYDVAGSFESSSPYTQLVHMLSEKHISEYFTVILHGHVNQEKKKTLLTNSSLYIHLENVTDETIEIEGFGISIIEAASYGVPALVAQGSATAEAVSDGVSGHIIDYENRNSVLEKIDNLILKGMLNTSQVLGWAKTHSPDAIFKQIEKIYIEKD